MISQQPYNNGVTIRTAWFSWSACEKVFSSQERSLRNFNFHIFKAEIAKWCSFFMKPKWLTTKSSEFMVECFEASALWIYNDVALRSFHLGEPIDFVVHRRLSKSDKNINMAIESEVVSHATTRVKRVEDNKSSSMILPPTPSAGINMTPAYRFLLPAKATFIWSSSPNTTSLVSYRRTFHPVCNH